MPFSLRSSGISSAIMEIVPHLVILFFIIKKALRRCCDSPRLIAFMTCLGQALVVRGRKSRSRTWTRNHLPQGGSDEKSDSSPSKPSDRRRKVRT